MAEVENLRIVIDIIDSFSSELQSLTAQLTEAERMISRVDGRNIDLDTAQAQASLTALQSQMAAMQSQFATMGVGGGPDGPGGRGGVPDTVAVGTLDVTAGTAIIKSATAVGGGGGGGLGGLTQSANQASRSMRNAASAAGEASEGFSATDIRMSDLHNALAKLVPLIFVVLGALPALIGGIVALGAAALAAAAALSALTVFAGLGAALARGDGDLMEGLTEIWEEVTQDFLDAFAPLARRLAHVFEDALDGLDRLFQAIAREGDSLVNLTEEAREFGGWVLATLPSFLRDLAHFADATDEALGHFAEAIGNVDFFRMFAEILDQTALLMLKFGDEIATFIAHLFHLSLGFFAVTNAIITALNWFIQIITVGGMLREELGILVAMLLSVWTATFLLNTQLFTLAGQALVRVGLAIVTWTVQLIGARAAAITAAIATMGLTKAMFALAGAIALTGIGALLVLFGGIAGGASMASSEIDEVTSSLRDLERQRSSMTGGNNPYADPDLGHGEATGRSRFAGGGSVNINVEGDADRETVRNQSHNAMYRMERTRRAR